MDPLILAIPNPQAQMKPSELEKIVIKRNQSLLEDKASLQAQLKEKELDTQSQCNRLSKCADDKGRVKCVTKLQACGAKRVRSVNPFN